MSGATQTADARNLDAAYLTLFDVRFTHGYYNDSDEVCPDFSVVPTPTCAALMESFDMIFKDQGTGFVVLVQKGRLTALYKWLSAHISAGSPEEGSWGWLSFRIKTENPNFIGITNLPITTNLSLQNFHLSNLDTVATQNSLYFAQDGGGVDEGAFYPVTGNMLSVRTAPDTAASLLDMTDAPINAPQSKQGDLTVFALNSVPAGFYTVVFSDGAGQRLDASDPPVSYVYNASSQVSAGLIDLCLTDPENSGANPDAFPITLGETAEESTATPVEIILYFGARKTFWRYYIVSPPALGTFAPNLAVTGTEAAFTRSSEMLPNGDEAAVFAADTALTLQRQSGYQFKLSGDRVASSGGRDRISIDRLPVAAAAPVWPAEDEEALTGTSEIYVYV